MTNRLTKIATTLTAGVVVLGVGAGYGRNAQAFPAYAKKEGKPCNFCHVNPSGGGKRTAAGIYYKAHGLSLVGFGGSVPAPPVRPIKPLAKPKPTKPVKAKTLAPAKASAKNKKS